MIPGEKTELLCSAAHQKPPIVPSHCLALTNYRTLRAFSIRRNKVEQEFYIEIMQIKILLKSELVLSFLEHRLSIFCFGPSSGLPSV